MSDSEMFAAGLLGYKGARFVRCVLRKRTVCCRCENEIASGESAFRVLRESRAVKRGARLCCKCSDKLNAPNQTAGGGK